MLALCYVVGWHMGKDARLHLNTGEIARALGVSNQTIYNWLRSGRIPEPERNPLTCYRLWSVEDIERIRTCILEARSQ
jgi:DNA-binding transcriptional MerR regulator